jgi:soluble cytochrome b562
MFHLVIAAPCVRETTVLNMSMIAQLRKPLILFLLGLFIASPVIAGELKPTMKEMRLHYKQAMDATTAEQFNKKIKLFMTELQIAREFDFSSERAKLSMEGLDKVYEKVAALPAVTEANLAAVKEQFKEVDELRKEYHKKVKPSGFDLLVKAFKGMFGL